MDFSEIFCTIFVSVFWILVTVKEVKEHRRQAPDGKVFVRDFVDKVKTIESATKSLGRPSIVEKDNFKFEIAVKEDECLKGLRWEYSPIHTSKCVYINDEPVCRIHRIDVSTKAKYYLDFTRERHLNEIIDIVESSYKACKYYEDNRWKNLLDPSNKSFYTIIK